MVWSLSEHFDKSPYSLLGRETSQRKGRAKEAFGTAGPVCGEDQKYPHVYWRDWSNKGEEKRRRWRAGKTRLDVQSAFGLSEMKGIVSWLFLVPESWLPLPAQDCSVQCGQWPCLLGACGAVGERRSWHVCFAILLPTSPSQVVLLSWWVALHFFDFTWCKNEYSVELYFESWSFAKLRYLASSSVVMLGGCRDTQLPVSHVILRVNNQYFSAFCGLNGLNAFLIEDVFALCWVLR